MMRLAFGAWCGRPGRAPKPAAAAGAPPPGAWASRSCTEEGGEGRGPDAGASELEEAPPGQKPFEIRVHRHSFVIVPSKLVATVGCDARLRCAEVSSRPDSRYSFVIVPSKFRIRLATIVYDASSATSNVSSRPDSPWLTSSRAAPRSAW